ncbi:MAG: hypothetical protein ABFD54_04080 [Armatimonadota bacterium]|nr:hypothetical protein [bacterium]
MRRFIHYVSFLPPFIPFIAALWNWDLPGMCISAVAAAIITLAYSFVPEYTGARKCVCDDNQLVFSLFDDTVIKVDIEQIRGYCILPWRAGLVAGPKGHAIPSLLPPLLGIAIVGEENIIQIEAINVDKSVHKLLHQKAKRLPASVVFPKVPLWADVLACLGIALLAFSVFYVFGR